MHAGSSQARSLTARPSASDNAKGAPPIGNWSSGRELWNLGYIGLDNMGGAFARPRLHEHKIRAFDLRPEVVARFAEAGAVPTQSAAGAGPRERHGR